MIITKRCGRCKEDKDIREFHRNSWSNDNVHNYCKECRGQMMKLYNKKHRERRRLYYAKRREEILMQNKAYYHKKKLTTVDMLTY